jgi:hypothetical protein
MSSTIKSSSSQKTIVDTHDNGYERIIRMLSPTYQCLYIGPKNKKKTLCRCVFDSYARYASTTSSISAWSLMYNYELLTDADDFLMNLMYIYSHFYDVLEHPRDRFHFLYAAIWPYDRSPTKSTTKLLFKFVPHDIKLCTHSVSLLLGFNTQQHQTYFSQAIIQKKKIRYILHSYSLLLHCPK